MYESLVPGEREEVCPYLGGGANGARPRADYESAEYFYGSFDRCVEMLNKTAGLCLR